MRLGVILTWLKALEDENGRLKWMLADAMLDNAALKGYIEDVFAAPALPKPLLPLAVTAPLGAVGARSAATGPG